MRSLKCELIKFLLSNILFKCIIPRKSDSILNKKKGGGMGQLTNDVLRTKNMIQLLKDMGMGLEGTQVICHGELVFFKSDSQELSQQLSVNLQSLLAEGSPNQPQFRTFSLAELLIKEVASGVCSDQKKEHMHKSACDAVLQILIDNGLKYNLDDQKEHIEIELPSFVYASLFNMLDYQYLSISGSTLRFNIKAFLKSYPNELIAINSGSPLLLINANIFESKKVFYAQTQLENGDIEIKPYFFIPHASFPPEYHFVLDTSGSMTTNNNLDTLKKSVIQLSKALFEFQPEAIINITAFNSSVTSLGCYNQRTLYRLQSDVNTLEANGSTCLYRVSNEQLNKIVQSKKHNNVLLFTDGENYPLDYSTQKKLESSIESVEKGFALVKARNKFFIIQYNLNQPTILNDPTESSILHRLTALFNSPVINSQSVDFMQALLSVNKMQEWAAARELFTCHLLIDNETKEYVKSYDLSGQFIALDPQHSKDGRVHLTIIDGDGNVILDDERSLISKKHEVIVSEPECIAIVEEEPGLDLISSVEVAEEQLDESEAADQNTPTPELSETSWCSFFNRRSVGAVVAAAAATVITIATLSMD